MDVRNNLLVVLTAPTTMNKKAQVLIFDVTKPQRPFKGPEDSPINYQCKCVATWPNTKGYAVGSIEGRVAIQHIQSVPRKDNFAFKCHRINNNSRRTWCSSAKRENITLLIHLLRGLTRNKNTQIRILNSRFALEHRYTKDEKTGWLKSWEPGWIGVVRGVRARELFQSISCFNDVTRISLASLTHATKK